MLLEDGKFVQANDYFENVLNIEPENAKAYIGKLCVELNIKREEDLIDYESSIVDYINYKRALQFADEKYRKALEVYALTEEEKNDRKQLQSLGVKPISKDSYYFCECPICEATNSSSRADCHNCGVKFLL